MYSNELFDSVLYTYGSLSNNLNLKKNYKYVREK